MKKYFGLVLLLLLLAPPAARAAGSGTGPDLGGGNENTLAGFDVKVFPNPVTARRFTIESSQSAIREVRILNIAGTEVLHRKTDGQNNRLQVFTGNIPNGVYLLKIQTSGQGTKTLKLLISHP